MKATKTTTQKKDLPAKSSGTVKGGGVNLNHNITMLRAARPTATKD